MKMRKFLATLSFLGLFTALSPSAMATDGDFEIDVATQNAATQSDHEAVAKYYEHAAAEAHEKMQKQEQLLEHYQDKSYLYGRQAQDLQSHTEALVHKYEKEENASIKQATLHRQMAAKLKENTYSAARLDH